MVQRGPAWRAHMHAEGGHRGSAWACMACTYACRGGTPWFSVGLHGVHICMQRGDAWSSMGLHNAHICKQRGTPRSSMDLHDLHDAHICMHRVDTVAQHGPA